MWQLYLLAMVATASAQIPSLGWCPDPPPMADFNMNRFLGTWYEAERYFTFSELGSRCITINYLSTPEGRILVSNEITSSLTGMKRVLEGSLQTIGREGEGRITVKYSTLSMPYDSVFSILDTDYDNFAVMWACSGIGPVHTQNVWLLSRDRLPSLSVMQNAYAVLDRYKISRTFFVKSNQADCNILPDPAAVPPIERTVDTVVQDNSEGVKNNNNAESVQAEEKSNVPQERTADPILEVPSKTMQLAELIISGSDKKEEKIDKPEETPMPIKDMPMTPMKDVPMMPMKEKPEKMKEPGMPTSHRVPHA